MGHACPHCQITFPTQRGVLDHCRREHRFPKPPPPPTTTYYHPDLDARPCTADGVFLNDPDAPPPPHLPHEDFGPFKDRVEYELAELLFEKMGASKGDVEHLMKILHARDILLGHDNPTPIFASHQAFLDTIDQIEEGETTWFTFSIQWAGPVEEDSPPWKRERFFVHTRDPRAIIKNLARNEEFNGKWDARPYQQFAGDAEDNRLFAEFMSGQWAWEEADVISQDPATHGSMLLPVNLSADKTTVSVATGNQEYHPVYMTVGNLHNDIRRSHRDAVVPLAFLPIPKTVREHENDPEFRHFKKHIYHAALRHMLSPLRPGMTAPQVMLCPDRHYRRAIYSLAVFTADYPEQVYASGIVQGWCPKCRAFPDHLDEAGRLRFRAHTEALWDTFEAGILWDVFGVVHDVTPFTYDFPRADIHTMLAPDLLHQLIKGTFKDHLVTWVQEYIVIHAASKREAKHILDDIDRRIAAVPGFPGLRRFPQGRNFKQWTGNDSRALMKVFLHSLTGYVPDDMIRCMRMFLDFAYLARRSAHDSRSLSHMEAVLEQFHELRAIFVDAGVRTSISLPRQHALRHYVSGIKLFGALNGLCTSITESKHITAVKRPWRLSNRNNPLIQILQRNTRLSKITALRVELGRRGLLEEGIVQTITALAVELNVPALHELVRRYLRADLFPGLDAPEDVVPLDECPWIHPSTSLAVHQSATATYYAPSELSLAGGMRSDTIRCAPNWFNRHPRYDTVLVQVGPEDAPLRGMAVGRVRALFAFDEVLMRHECALVEWFDVPDEEPDPVTGMWIVEPELYLGGRAADVIPLNSIVRACHLIGCCGNNQIPIDFDFTHTLDAFHRFHLNPYIDYHMHELLASVE
ncbi:hypothetical protein C8Q80DRAFT_1222300 [Daedaleopsis nitida]|nr:hypothetical protein C8Q80DRAFT_1222300 [Daedaleopsis nitida]